MHYEEKFRTGIVRKEELGEGGWIMKKVFWMVDGVVMQPRTGHCKEDICLGIIYQVLKEYREGRHIHGGKNMAIDESFE